MAWTLKSPDDASYVTEPSVATMNGRLWSNSIGMSPPARDSLAYNTARAPASASRAKARDDREQERPLISTAPPART